MGNESGGGLVIVMVLVISVAIGLIPSAIAHERKHHQKMAIFVLNLFALAGIGLVLTTSLVPLMGLVSRMIAPDAVLGWAILFWIGACVWAFTEVRKIEQP